MSSVRSTRKAADPARSFACWSSWRPREQPPPWSRLTIQRRTSSPHFRARFTRLGRRSLPSSSARACGPGCANTVANSTASSSMVYGTTSQSPRCGHCEGTRRTSSSFTVCSTPTSSAPFHSNMRATGSTGWPTTTTFCATRIASSSPPRPNANSPSRASLSGAGSPSSFRSARSNSPRRARRTAQPF